MDATGDGGPGNADAWQTAISRGLANLLVEQRRSPEAVALLEDWSRRRPDDPNPRIELARLCVDHGDLAGAENHLVDALAIDPANARALGALGEVRGDVPRGGAGAAATAPAAGAVAVRGEPASDAPQGGIVRVAALPAVVSPSDLPTAVPPPQAAVAFPAR